MDGLLGRWIETYLPACGGGKNHAETLGMFDMEGATCCLQRFPFANSRFLDDHCLLAEPPPDFVPKRV